LAEVSTNPILSAAIFTPLLGAIVVLFLPRAAARSIRAVATVALSVPVVLVAVMAATFEPARPGLQFVERADWIPFLHISYFVGVDGLSLALLALSAVVGLVAGIASYGIGERVKEYFALFLLMQTSLLGVFAAEDLILFMFFFDVVLIPMYFLIGVWGGVRREYAALKFLIFTLVGSVVMTVGVLALYVLTGQQTFSIPQLIALVPLHVSLADQRWIFLAILLAFVIKLPMVPFHTWLPDAYAAGPTPLVIFSSGAVLKIGGYGLLRIAMPLFPAVAHSLSYGLAVLGVISILYGALAALAQSDVQRLLGYSSVSHMGFVLLGIAAATPLAVDGAVFEMIAHGLIASLLFLMTGVFYERTRTWEMRRLGGMYTSLPLAGTILGFAGIANLGLPTLAAFVAEFFVLLGTFAVYPVLVVWAVVGVVLIAAFNLVMMRRVLMGPPREEWSNLAPLKVWELMAAVPLMAFTVALGVYPAAVMSVLNSPVLQFVARMGGR
jgi:NADH-quinone oxidoreductase subunit M